MAQQVSQSSQPEAAESEACCHHWSIQPATGPVSQGVCQRCGEVREFKNYVEAATWGDSRLANRTNVDDSQGLVKPVTSPAEDKDEEEEE